MRIVVARRDSLTHMDGVTRFTATLAKGLALLGHRVALMSWGLLDAPNGYSDFNDYLKGVYGIESIDVLTIRGHVSSHPEPRVSIDWLLRGSRVLREWDADAIIISGVAPLTFRPRVAVLHNVTRLRSRVARWLYRRLYKSYDVVVCVSKKSSSEALSAGVRCGRVIYNPVDLKPFRPRGDREPLVVHIGTRGEKNVDISIHAVKMMRDRGYNLRLAVIGPGASNSVKNFLGEVPEWVLPLDNASEEVKADMLSRSKALLLPSSYETFSYVAVEAMASGTPPIVSEAVPEEVVMDGVNGLRVPELRPEAFAEALARLINDEDLWWRLSEAGVNWAKRYDYMTVAKEYESLLHEIINKG
ncbi:Glycosyl transferase group 1 [Acidilobus saccharovorans 345-15]|uniref:Glycosyl transferase group 1 n=1 Tax=Acidilobus saccharovorans (strain DSM 16705 / JCM 18335 / VKM B-2471 / 345-15) TaxID=666510 RepID=D9Q196_ACIS3|nr:glycosyltransferase family 4 protein [Acidilobus saccharovorans]ADL19084.1 Glycosyl transferase group 1 [Acidilobus saccharovorans 345-15]